jgi:hypothetical protein
MMRSRGHMGIMLAAAAAALAGVEGLGAQRMALPVPNIPSLGGGGSRGKPGKNRNSGRGSRAYRGGSMTAHCGHKQAAKYARQGAGINVHYHERMRWNAEVYPRVLELQRKQREQNR